MAGGGGALYCTVLYCTVLYFTVLLQVGLVHGPASRKPFCGGTLISDHEVRHRVDIVDILDTVDICIYVSRC